jgi:hypothetical protein
LSDGALWALGIGGVVVGAGLGVVGAFVVDPLILAWTAVGVFLAAGYSLELSSLLHSNWGFALAWGAFPALVGYWSQTLSLSWGAVFMAAAATVLSRAQRELSTPARRLRRTDSPAEVTGWDRGELLATWERPLRLLSLAVPLLAASLLATHL